MGIVEIALDGSDGNVVAGLGDHLQSLDFACAVMRVEHGNAQPGGIRETSQSSLTGIAARCGKNHDFFARALRSSAHELRKHLQRNIFEGACRAAEEFEHERIADLYHGSNVIGFKGAFVSSLNARLNFFSGIVIEQRTQDIRGIFAIRVRHNAFEIDFRFAQRIGNVEAAIGSKAIEHRTFRGHACIGVSSAVVHRSHMPPFRLVEFALAYQARAMQYYSFVKYTAHQR